MQPGPIEWLRIDFGTVSAYLVIRGTLAALVDTGPSSDIEPIEAALASAGLSWDAVGDVILTHDHPDHAGGLEKVVERAGTAAVSAGTGAFAGRDVGVPIIPLVDGSFVFGLETIATPGHTEHHVSLLETTEGVLIAGDAVRGSDAGGGAPGEVIGPDQSSTHDLDEATTSVRRLAAREIDVILFGHGTPIESAGGERLADFLTSS